MDQNTLLVIMAVFVAIAAIALVIQAGMLIGIYVSSKAVGERVAQLAPKVEALIPKVEALLPKVEALAETSRLALEDGRVSLKEITSRTSEILDRTNDILDSAKRQVAHVEGVIEDVSLRARVQLDRAEMVMDDAMTRAQDTIAVVHGGIMKPVREINGVAMGLKAALNYFMRGRGPQPDQATADEEMFI
jgi:uncharacterized protein YoxC